MQTLNRIRNNHKITIIKQLSLYFFKLLIGPLIALPFLLGLLTIPSLNATIEISKCAGITLWIALWWLFQPIPIAITSLLPLLLFPLFNVASGKEIAESYMSDLSFLFIGSFMIAIALERWNLHLRFSLFLLKFIGMRKRLILFVMMISSFTLSMWLSNSCTTAMLLPIANAVILSMKKNNHVGNHVDNHEKNNVEVKDEKEKKEIESFAKALFMSIAYSSSIGGMTTLTGTPTNLVLIHTLNVHFLSTLDQIPVTFFKWTCYSFPINFIFLFVTFIYLVIIYCRNFKSNNTKEREEENIEMKDIVNNDDNMIKNESKEDEKEDDEIELVNSKSTAYLLTEEKEEINEQVNNNVELQQDEMIESYNIETNKKGEADNIFKKEYSKLGKIKFEEIILILLFITMCLLWIFRDLKIGSISIGWNYLIYLMNNGGITSDKHTLNYTTDGTVAILIGMLLFFIPSFNEPPNPKEEHLVVKKEEENVVMKKEKEEKQKLLNDVDNNKLNDSNYNDEERNEEPQENYDTNNNSENSDNNNNHHTNNVNNNTQRWKVTGRLLNWKIVQQEMPWNILLLLGAGFALAKGFTSCKFSDFVVNLIVVKFDLANKIHPYLMVFIICTCISILTEFSSNVGTASILLPLLASMSVQIGQNPLFFMVPATLACSFAFMTPIGTAPNSLAYGYGYFSLKDMVITGVILNTLGLVFCLLGLIIFGPVLDISLNQVPSWANSTMIETQSHF
ncbi:hypothetical protein ABK040_015698 [Willaertia magna]